jgi:hypothetical protein
LCRPILSRNPVLVFVSVGVQYLEGGVASVSRSFCPLTTSPSPHLLCLFPFSLALFSSQGFKHIDPNNFTPRLFHVKGKHHVRVTQVATKASSLNQGDVFILDMGKEIYQWNGKEANKYEKFKGLEMVTKIKNEERGGKPTTTFLEHDSDNATFWKTLGGSLKDVKSAEQGGSDDESKHNKPILLYKYDFICSSLSLALFFPPFSIYLALLFSELCVCFSFSPLFSQSLRCFW